MSCEHILIGFLNNFIVSISLFDFFVIVSSLELFYIKKDLTQTFAMQKYHRIGCRLQSELATVTWSSRQRAALLVAAGTSPACLPILIIHYTIPTELTHGRGRRRVTFNRIFSDVNVFDNTGLVLTCERGNKYYQNVRRRTSAMCRSPSRTSPSSVRATRAGNSAKNNTRLVTGARERTPCF